MPNLNSIKKLITDNFKNCKVSIEDNLLLLKENEINDKEDKEEENADGKPPTPPDESNM